MEKFFKQVKLSSFLVILILNILVSVVPNKVLAIEEVQEVVDVDNHLKQLESIERCDDQNKCLGLCKCTMEIKTSGIIFTSKKYSWRAYRQFDNFIVGRAYGSNLPLFEGKFNFNNQGCDITFEGDKTAIQQYARKQCQYYKPFCCCKVDAFTNKLLSCQRFTHRNLDTFQPWCSGLGEGEVDSYKPYPEPAQGCADLLKDRSQDVDTSTPPDPEYISKINLHNETRPLNQLTYFSGVNDFIGQIIKVLLAFIGSISLALYVWAGLVWMTASGSSERIGKAKKILIWTTLGDAVMLGSYIIVAYLFDLLK
jgi:hypothetical protein